MRSETFTETKSIPTPLNSPDKSKKHEIQESNSDRIITQIKDNSFKSSQTQDYELKSTEDKDQDTRKLRKEPVKLNKDFFMDLPNQKGNEKEGNKVSVKLPHEKFKILHHNVQGFTNKQLELTVLLNTNLQDLDIK